MEFWANIGQKMGFLFQSHVAFREFMADQKSEAQSSPTLLEKVMTTMNAVLRVICI